MNWNVTFRSTLEELLPAVGWSQLLQQIKRSAGIAARFGFEIIAKPLPERAY